MGPEDWSAGVLLSAEDIGFFDFVTAVEGSGRVDTSKDLAAAALSASLSESERFSKPSRRAAVRSSASSAADEAAFDSDSKGISSAAVVFVSAAGSPASACASCVAASAVVVLEVRGFLVEGVASAVPAVIWDQSRLGHPMWLVCLPLRFFCIVFVAMVNLELEQESL